jgi:hypothetical protein
MLVGWLVANAQAFRGLPFTLLHSISEFMIMLILRWFVSEVNDYCPL